MITSWIEWEERQVEEAVANSASSMLSPSVEEVAELTRSERLKYE